MTDIAEHQLTEKEKELREWLRSQPGGDAKWFVIKAGFRNSYELGQADTADAIAHQLAVKVCGPLCEHPSCSTYRFAARIAREHATPRPRIPEQGGDPT